MSTSVSSSSSTSVSNESYSNNGISGLMSGIDTDSIVESMLSGIQTKIDKANQDKQILEWKQEMYRDIIDEINDFSDKYFNLTSDTCLRSASFFSQTSVESSSSAVQIVSNNSSSVTEFSIEVNSLASAASLTSSKSNADNSITFSLDSNGNIGNYERTIDITIGEGDDAKTVSVDFASLTSLSSASSEEQNKAVVDAINDALTAQGVTGFQASIDSEDGKISFSSDTAFTITGNTAGLAAIGRSVQLSSTENEETGEFSAKGANAVLTTVGGSFDITYDGVTKSVSITEGQSFDDIAKQITKSFGTGITFDYSTDGQVTMKVGDGHQLSVSANTQTMKLVGVDSGSVTTSTDTSSTISSLMGIGSDDEYTISINGTDIALKGSDTIARMMNKINASDAGVTMTYNDLGDTFSITNNNLGSGFSIDLQDNGGLMDKLGFSNSTVKAGTDAELMINGNKVYRSSNEFTYNGVTMKLKSTTSEPATISSTRDVDKIVDTIKSFVNDYNELISKLNGYTHEEATYKDYAPLTTAQKKEMTENEIELWEEKAKEGLLRGDNDISDFLQSMRSSIYTKSSSAKYALSNIGIDTSDNWKDYGKLVLDEDTLKSYLTNDLEGVYSAFAGDNGIINKLKNACDNAASTSSASPGSLVTLAGVVGKGTENDNTIKDRLDAIADKLERLQQQYDQRKERYWAQFNAMETAMSQTNSQSSWLSSVFA